MAWNEPGGGKDPWGTNNSGDGPPDLDEALNKLRARFSKLFGGSADGGNNGSSGGLIAVVLAVLVIGWGLFGFYQVDEKEQAVVLRLGKYLDTVGSGLHCGSRKNVSTRRWAKCSRWMKISSSCRWLFSITSTMSKPLC